MQLFRNQEIRTLNARLQHEVGVSVRTGLVEGKGALTLTSCSKKSCTGATAVVHTNKVTGGIWIASCLFMLYDTTEMASVNITYQNV